MIKEYKSNGLLLCSSINVTSITHQFPYSNNNNDKEIEKWILRLQGGFPPYSKMNEFERETVKMILEVIYLPSAQNRTIQFEIIFARLNNMSSESVGVMWGLLLGFLSEVIQENYQLENEIEILRTKITNT